MNVIPHMTSSYPSHCCPRKLTPFSTVLLTLTSQKNMKIVLKRIKKKVSDIYFFFSEKVLFQIFITSYNFMQFFSTEILFSNNFQRTFHIFLSFIYLIKYENLIQIRIRYKATRLEPFVGISRKLTSNYYERSKQDEFSFSEWIW